MTTSAHPRRGPARTTDPSAASPATTVVPRVPALRSTGEPGRG